LLSYYFISVPYTSTVAMALMCWPPEVMMTFYPEVRAMMCCSVTKQRLWRAHYVDIGELTVWI
jgi:hypothetical protein